MKRQRVTSHGKGLPCGRPRVNNYNYCTERDELSIAEQLRLRREDINQSVKAYFEFLSAEKTDGLESDSDYELADESTETIDVDMDENDIPAQSTETKKLEVLRLWIALAGYKDVLDLAAAEAETSPKLCTTWILSGGFDRFLSATTKALPLRC